MPEAVAIADVVSLLHERLRSSPDMAPVQQVLRALQRLGLTQQDLIVHLERLRVANDLTDNDPDFDERALIALGLVQGDEPDSLRWDAADQAAIWLEKCLTESTLQAAIPYAITPSDLLPPRPADRAPDHLVEWMLQTQLQRLARFEAVPERAEFFRVPKVAFTTRPAALLALSDRLSFEALASIVEGGLDRHLSPQVKWPRRRADPPPTHEYAEEPLSWNSSYIAKADVAAFYECVDHSLLAVIAALRLQTRSAVSQALELLLDAVMGNSFGLPQGPPASDIFASIYLLPVDDKLVAAGWPFLRYADDYYLAASTPAEGRLRLAQLETWLQELGLSLSVEKTQVMKRTTYERGLVNRSRSVDRVRDRVQRMTEAQLLASEYSDQLEETLRDAGVDEELLFDLLYHQTTTLEDVIEDVREQLAPSLIDSYVILFDEKATVLMEEEIGDEAAQIERDLRECLMVLAGGHRAVRFAQLEVVLEWFPRTAPHVSAYLSATADLHPEQARGFLQHWLDPVADSDWVTGWLCYAAERSDVLRSAELLDVCERLTVDPDVGWLTRTTSSRVLAMAGQLTEMAWQVLYAQAPPAIKSELAFSVIASRSLYPWSMPPEIGSASPGS